MIRRKRNPGWFKKGGHKKRHRAKRRTRSHSRGRRRPRRRSNPHLLLANPSRGTQLPLFDPAGHKISPVLIRAIREGAAMRKKNKRKSSKPRRKPRKTTSRRSKGRATARRHGKRQYYRIYHGRGRRPKFRIYRRSNPFGTWFGLARIGAFGGLGIVAARIGGRLYTDYVGKTVAPVGTDPKSWRAIANEALRIVAMGAVPIMVGRHVLRRIPIVSHADTVAFELGGLAEAGRQGIGVVLKRVSPSLNAGKWGLDGLGAYDEVRDDGQQLYGRQGRQWYVIGYSNGSMAGLEQRGSFGALMESEGFGDADMSDAGDVVDVVG